MLDIERANIEEVIVHDVPNGGRAVLDADNKIIAYNKSGDPDGNNWSYVRADCRRD